MSDNPLPTPESAVQYLVGDLDLRGLDWREGLEKLIRFYSEDDLVCGDPEVECAYLFFSAGYFGGENPHSLLACNIIFKDGSPSVFQTWRFSDGEEEPQDMSERNKVYGALRSGGRKIKIYRADDTVRYEAISYSPRQDIVSFGKGRNVALE